MQQPRFKSIILAVAASCTIAAAQTPVTDLTGIWDGPNDLIMEITSDADRHPDVTYCGIYRTIGWTDVTTVIKGDSIIMTSRHADEPLVGRFLIESTDTMSGTLTTGNPDRSWYFNGPAHLRKRKPEMPANLNPALEGILLPSDYEFLSADKEIAANVLSAIMPGAYGYSEKEAVAKLLDAKTYPITPEEMIGFRKVRSIQIDAGSGIFSYPYFNCRFNKANGKVFFEKTSGSQRKSGYLYQNTPHSLVFLGGWSVNNDTQKAYGSANSAAGTVYKIGPRKAIMIFLSGENRIEIYELIK